MEIPREPANVPSRGIRDPRPKTVVSARPPEAAEAANAGPDSEDELKRM